MVTIRKAVDASPELRSKKQLIETFIAGVNDVDDILGEWNDFVAKEREKELAQIIREEKLKGFFERFFGIGGAYAASNEEQIDKVVTYDFTPSVSEMMVAEESVPYGRKED